MGHLLLLLLLLLMSHRLHHLQMVQVIIATWRVIRRHFVGFVGTGFAADVRSVIPIVVVIVRQDQRSSMGV